MPWIDEGSIDASTPETRAVRALVTRIERYVIAHTPPAGSGMPDGIRLEMHPHVHYLLLRSWIPLFSEFAEDYTAGPLSKVQIPVKVNPELPRGGWRLVVVTEDVIDSGTVPDGVG